jgi:uncharacterized membrane protein YeaQ/YmgE (transglycosylase-associated protein family)
MSIIAWIILGLGAGLLTNLAVHGERRQGRILTCLIGIAGALLGGWGATTIFHVHSLNGFFSASTWPTAVTGAAVLLLACHLSPPVRPVAVWPVPVRLDPGHGPARDMRTAKPPARRISGRPGFAAVRSPDLHESRT